MKNSILAIFLMFAATASYAQDSLRISRQEPQYDDILAVFESMDINMYRFDLSGLLRHKYDAVFYIDEYRDGKYDGRLHNIHFGTNIVPLDIYPEEDRDKLRQIHGLGPDDKEFDNITAVSVFTKPLNDSTALITIRCHESGTMGSPVKLYPAGPDSIYSYHCRPFIPAPAADTDTLKIPLVLYGSGWYDERFGLIRFCGEAEIDPETKADILEYSPHYYVIGVDMIRKDSDEEQ